MSKIAQAYVTMLTFREKFPVSAEQQGVLCNLRDALVELMELSGKSAQEIQDAAELIAYDNRVDHGLAFITIGHRGFLRDQANVNRRFLGLQEVDDRQVQPWSKTGIHNPV